MVTSTDDDGNVVDIDVTGAATISGLPNTAPTRMKNFTIDAQVDDTGNSTQVHGTVDLSTLFQDLNGDRLTYEVTTFSQVATDRSTSDDGDPRNTEFVGGDADHVASFKIDGSTGTLSYSTDLKNSHDGSGGEANDGAGNWVSFTVRANDGDTAEGSRPTAMVNVRLNVKPSDITETEITGGYSHQEQTFTADTHIADLNVIDENLSGSATTPGHPYGIHTVTVSDDRFGIRHNIDTTDPTKDEDGDGSTWELYIKKGATFDFDAAMDANPATPEKEVEIDLTITATDGGGKMIEMEDLITITITNDTDDDAELPDAGDTVPGLSDTEAERRRRQDRRR